MSASIDLFEQAVRRLGEEIRAAYSAGQRPTALIRHAWTGCPAGWAPGSIYIIMVFRAAFDLPLAQCKEAGEFWRGGPDAMDEAGMDRFLTACIEEARPHWDVP